MFVSRLSISFVSLLLSARLLAQTSVLFIGNSYTTENDLPNTFRLLAQSLGEDVTVAVSAPGGFTFQDHYTYGPTHQLLESQDWDFVVLQEQSQLPAFPDDIEETTMYGGILTAYIETNYECTWPVFYMTWGRENGDQQNCASNPPVCTYEGMQQLIRDRYVQLGLQNDGRVAPVGVAWQEIMATQPGIDLFQPDGSHPTLAGTYLAACVMYATIFHQSSEASTYYAGLPTDIGDILQNIASSTVLDDPDTWNLYVPSGTDATIMGMSGNGPTEITYYHHGQGTHLWTSSNGQSATGTSATFTFEEPGIYSFTHIYNDPCGNTDTVTWNGEVYPIGLEEIAQQHQVITAKEGGVEISEVPLNTHFILQDMLGRLITEGRMTSDRLFVPCRPGPMVWRLLSDRSTVSGKVVVP
jgi:hypothetical protein